MLIKEPFFKVFRNTIVKNIHLIVAGPGEAPVEASSAKTAKAPGGKLLLKQGRSLGFMFSVLQLTILYVH